MIPAIGEIAAARLHRAMVVHTLNTFAHSGDLRWIAVSPTEAVPAVGVLAGPQWNVSAQTSGALGNRIVALMRSLMEHSERVVIIGTDCPQLRSSGVAEAMDRLLRRPVVIGPASDGGYYLIALRGPWDDSMRALFDPIDWGTDRVAHQTRTAARSLGLAVDQLETLSDVDRTEDLTRLVHWLEQDGGEGRLRDEVQRILRESTGRESYASG